MTSTENYKLTKFSEPEYYNVNLFNENMDKVDAAVKEAYTITPERIGYAGVENAGLIKLYSSGSTNRSGLVVYEDGSCVVNTKPDRGITRDGVGQIGINPATQTEVDTGTEAYKPVTPKTLRDLKCIYEADISKVGSGNNILYITIPGVTSYDDLNGKSVKLYTGIYSNNVKQTVYVNINGLGSRAIRRVTTDSSYETSIYAPYEINRYMVMELYISGTSVRWVNPPGAPAGEQYNLQKYSTTPQRVGTWIDGTPIWRVAIQQTVSDEGRKDGAVFPILPVQNPMAPFIVNEYMRLIYTDDCVVDDIGLSPISGGCYDISKWASNTNYDKISGWIEFATPESNLKTT